MSFSLVQKAYPSTQTEVLEREIQLNGMVRSVGEIVVVL